MEPGEIIRQHRIELGRSQAWLARQIGTSQPQIGKLEKGIRRVGLGNALRIGHALDIDPLLLVDKYVNQFVRAVTCRERQEENEPADFDVMEEAIISILESIKKSELALPPRKTAGMVVWVYSEKKRGQGLGGEPDMRQLADDRVRLEAFRRNRGSR